MDIEEQPQAATRGIPDTNIEHLWRIIAASVKHNQFRELSWKPLGTKRSHQKMCRVMKQIHPKLKPGGAILALVEMMSHVKRLNIQAECVTECFYFRRFVLH